MTNCESSDLLTGYAAIGSFLGWKARTVRHLASRGEMPIFNVGGKCCARRSTLNAWLAEREAAALAAQHRPPQGC